MSGLYGAVMNVSHYDWLIIGYERPASGERALSDSPELISFRLTALMTL